MKSNPRVACVCRTFGRLGYDFDHSVVLDETVESFLRQDYPNKMMVLINDTPNQLVEFSHPDVVVINSETRFSSIGFKQNFGIELASKADLIFMWDDDDISFPWRISQTVSDYIRHGDKFDYIGEGTYWVSTNNAEYLLESNIRTGITAGASYTRKSAIAYPYHDVVGEDYVFYEEYFKHGLGVCGELRSPDRASFIYRWGNVGRHVSGFPAADGYEQLGKDSYPATTIVIKPRWQYDYVKHTRNLLRDGNFVDKRVNK